MKLRTRLTVGAVLLLALALSACCVLMIYSSRQVLLEDAVAYTLQEGEQLDSSFNSALLSVDWNEAGGIKEALLRYYFAELASHSAAGSEYVLQSETGILFNNSGIDVREVLKSQETMGAEMQEKTIQYRVVHLNQKNYCIAGQEQWIGDEEYMVAVVRDITDSMDQVRTLALRCILISAGVTVLTAALTALFLEKALRPVRTLQKGAASVAQGDYSSRIQLERRDELGALAASFNQMAAAVQRHVQEVEATSEERNMLLHALAHEMRTPVTALSGYAYALNHARMSETQQQEAIEFIDSESRRLARLAAKLTELILVSDSQPMLTAVELPVMKQSLGRLLRPQAEQAGICLSFDFEEGCIQGDSDLLVMLVTNLFDNARKAGASDITISFRKSRLAVSDNGCGIPAEQAEKIMQPFYQGDASRNQEGFGLGLALCQKIAVLHGSSLLVESTPGQGSTFSVSFYNSFTSP